MTRRSRTSGGRRRGQPFFLFAHYWDPHTPYLPPAPFSRMFYAGDERDPPNRSMDPVFAFEPFTHYFQQWMGGVTDIRFPVAQYDAEIAYVDSALAHVFSRLDALDLTESTLVIVTADHGECLDDHVCWFDHHGLYEENVHVPLLMRLPGRIPAGRRIEGFATLTDVAPTVLEAIGLGEVAGQEGMEGQSLWGQLTGARPRRVGARPALPHRVHLDAQAGLADAGVEADRGPRAGPPRPPAGRAVQPQATTRASRRTWPGATLTWCSRCTGAWSATPRGACGPPGSPIRCRRKRSPCARSASSRRRCPTINGCAKDASQRDIGVRDTRRGDAILAPIV